MLLAELSESDELPLLDEEDEDPDEDEDEDEPEDPEVLPLNLGFGGILIKNLSFNLPNSSSCERFHFCSIIVVPRAEVWFGMFRNIIIEQCRIYSLGRLRLVLPCLEVKVMSIFTRKIRLSSPVVIDHHMREEKLQGKEKKITQR